MADPGSARSGRSSISRHSILISVFLAAFVATVALWLILRGGGLQNLSPFVTFWGGAFAIVWFIAGKHRPIAVSLASLCFVLTIVELASLAYETTIKAPPKKYFYTANTDAAWISEHDAVGYAFKGPVALSASASIGDEFLYRNVPYEIDGFSRRSCESSGNPSRHALFFGGSFAFGEGLPNERTLGCEFQRISGGTYRSETYAMMGWGASQTLIQLGYDSLFSDIRQPSGIAVHSFIGDHVFRTTWNLGAASDFPCMPFFRLSQDGALEGPFNSTEEWHLGLARDLFTTLKSTSPTFRALVRPEWFRTMNEHDAAITTARVLGAAGKRYRQRFDGEFIVLLWPRSRLTPAVEAAFVSELDEQGVVVIDVPPLPGDPLEAQLHPLDGHPSAKEARWVARCLYDAIETAGL